MEATAKRSLFDIGEEMLELERTIESFEGDISDPAAEAAIVTALETLADDQAVKLDGYVNLIRKWEMQEAAAKEEAERYLKIRQVRAARVEALKDRIKEHFEKTGQKMATTATGRTVRVQANSTRPVEWKGEYRAEDLEKRFQKVTVSVDTTIVKEALKAGEELAFARLGPAGSHLRIA